MPATPTIDGDLADWPDEIRGIAGLGRGGSQVALALTGDAMLIVGSLKKNATRGFWLDLKSEAPAVPVIGDWTRGGGRDPFECDYVRDYIAGEYIRTNKRLPANKSRECHAMVRRYEAFKVEYANRFLRRYKVDETGVQGTDATGKLVAIDGAQVAWKKTADGASVEVSLPLTAMPRVTEAPLMGLQVWAAASSSAPPAIGAQATRVFFPPAVSFEPLGDLRRVVADALMQPGYVGDSFISSSGFSYQPGDPERVELLTEGGNAGVGPEVKPLFEKLATVGTLQVGVSRLLVAHAVAMVEGHVTAFESFDGAFRGAMQRNGQVHLFASKQGGYSMMASSFPPRWEVIAILPDGSFKALIDTTTMDAATAEAGCGMTVMVFDTPGELFSSPDYHTFGWRGSCRGDDANAPLTGFEVTWTWNDTMKVYEGTHRLIPVADVH